MRHRVNIFWIYLYEFQHFKYLKFPLQLRTMRCWSCKDKFSGCLLVTVYILLTKLLDHLCLPSQFFFIIKNRNIRLQNFACPSIFIVKSDQCRPIWNLWLISLTCVFKWNSLKTQKQFYWGIYRKPVYHMNFFILPTMRSNHRKINKMVIITRKIITCPSNIGWAFIWNIIESTIVLKYSISFMLEYTK